MKKKVIFLLNWANISIKPFKNDYEGINYLYER